MGAFTGVRMNDAFKAGEPPQPLTWLDIRKSRKNVSAKPLWFWLAIGAGSLWLAVVMFVILLLALRFLVFSAIN
jgi:hypothetical protein